MKLSSKNIVNSFFKRAIFAMVSLSILSSISIYFFQQYNFYSSLAYEIQIHVNERFEKYSENLKFSSKEGLEDDVKAVMRQLGFIIIEMYDDEKKELFSFTAMGQRYEEKLKLIQKHDKIVIHDFPTSTTMSYDFFEVPNNQHFLQIFYPIYKSERLLGYIEGILYIEPLAVNQFKRGIFVSIVMVVSTILIFSLLIFPLIYFAYRKLNQHRLDLLSSNIMTINTLGNAIALRDSDTNEHNYRVTLYAIKLAQELNLECSDMKKLIKGAFLHDVGKIGISDTILLKNGTLDKNEFKIMREHVIKGVELVRGNNWLEDSKDVILFHHEKYDGSGYPNKIEGKNIPKIARIFTIIDVFDALTSKRPYKEPFSYEKSIAILKEGRGGHFDATILDTFIGISNALYLGIHLKPKEQLKNELDVLIKKYFLDY